MTITNVLNNLPVSVHATTPQGARFDRADFPGWSSYDLAFDHYLNIGESDFQVVCNETHQTKGFIDAAMALDILCAMYKQKSIVMLHLPTFMDDVDDFSRQLIADKLGKIYVCDISQLDSSDLNIFVRSVISQAASYNLTNYDLRQISLRVHTHLRRLQGPPI